MKKKVNDLLESNLAEINSKVSIEGIYYQTISRISKRREFILDEDFSFVNNSHQNLFDSPVEQKFLTKYLTKFGEKAPHWFTPQADIGSILKSNRAPRVDRQGRLDFLVSHPLMSKTINVELDGESHELQQTDDNQRDDELKQCGIEVIRIRNSEMQKRY